MANAMKLNIREGKMGNKEISKLIEKRPREEVDSAMKSDAVRLAFLSSVIKPPKKRSAAGKATPY